MQQRWDNSKIWIDHDRQWQILYQIDFLRLLGILHKVGLMDSSTFGKPQVKQIYQVSLLLDFLRVFKILIVIVNI